MNISGQKLGDFLSRIALFITAVSVFTFAMGCFIINAHLSNFHLQDFDLLKPRAVLVGFTFILLIATNIGIYFIVPLNLLKHPIDTSSLLRHTITKFFYVTLIVFYMFNQQWAINEFCQFRFFGHKYDIREVLWSSFTWLLLANVIVKERGATKWMRWLKIFIFCSTSLMGILLCLLYFNIWPFIPIFFSQLLITALVDNHHSSARQSNQRLLDVEDGEEEEQYDSVKDSKVKEYVKQFRKNYSTLLRVSYSLLGVFAFLLITLFYSKYFYPKIAQNLGGGSLEQITYVMGNDTITGKKVYETESYVFLVLNDETIKKLDWKDISKILNKKLLKNTNRVETHINSH
jgi:hypothetical protein